MSKASANGGSHSASFIEKQHQRLLDLRDSLVDSMTGMTRDTIRNAPEGSEASGSGQHHIRGAEAEPSRRIRIARARLFAHRLNDASAMGDGLKRLFSLEL